MIYIILFVVFVLTLVIQYIFNFTSSIFVGALIAVGSTALLMSAIGNKWAAEEEFKKMKAEKEAEKEEERIRKEEERIRKEEERIRKEEIFLKKKKEEEDERIRKEEERVATEKRLIEEKLIKERRKDF